MTNYKILKFAQSLLLSCVITNASKTFYYNIALASSDNLVKLPVSRAFERNFTWGYEDRYRAP